MTDQQVVFVYQNKKDKNIEVKYIQETLAFEQSADYVLIATVEPKLYIAHLLNENPEFIDKIKAAYND